ncbi:hypothetical protein [Jannaschia sp. W003]|uniref:hypothetical protein n=1 Tax=Jannaschia sp. W003 TaxID=2867012 RepID=UPI0021A78F17|nr:hypothetical protein [Jannaschia sp. W003]UWQ21683.1 hypothetical protein K3554_01235 [Jannaschia sp. W003]
MATPPRTARRDAVPPTSDLAHDAVERTYDTRGRAVWGAIFAGTAVALAVFVLLGVAGIGLGFTLFEPDEATPANGALTTTAIWQFLSQLVALAAGGFVAGRLAGVIPSVGAAIHGACVWALTTLAALWLAVSAASGIMGVAGSALSTAASGATSAVGAVIPDDLSLPDLSVPSVAIDSLPEGVQSALREQGLTPQAFRRETREAFRAVVSQREQAAIAQEATEAAADAIRSPGDIGQDVSGFLDTVFGRGGVLGEEDREEALAQMERRFGLTRAEAEQFVDTVQARAEEAQAEAAAALEEAQAAALEAADTAADAAATAAWLAALASLIGLGAAIGGAVAGRVARA